MERLQILTGSLLRSLKESTAWGIKDYGRTILKMDLKRIGPGFVCLRIETNVVFYGTQQEIFGYIQDREFLD
jgi:hypothetical protein